MASSNDEFTPKYQNLLNRYSRTAENGECLIWEGWGVQKMGQYFIAKLQIRLPGASKPTKINVARLSRMLFENNFDVSKDLDASHLCHNSLCTRAEHIHFEPRSVNNNRHICVSVRQCIHHQGHPDCLIHLKLGLAFQIQWDFAKYGLKLHCTCMTGKSKIQIENKCNTPQKWDKEPALSPTCS